MGLSRVGSDLIKIESADVEGFLKVFNDPDFGGVDFLKSLNVKPSFFGLGFIQLKINNVLRMHFWHPELSADVSEEELHDHRYDFKSHIIHGVTTHEVFEFEPNKKGKTGLFSVSCDLNNPAEPKLETIGEIVPAGSYTMTKGSQYEFPHNQFHRIRAAECITLVERKIIIKSLAKVAKPIEAEHVCPFSREIHEDKLWEYISELVEDRVREPGGGYHLKPIPKGSYGEASKITEENLEFLDALKQKNPVMALVELSDQIGAIAGWLENNHPSISFDDLIVMNEATKRAFQNGHRS